ncbi:MAG: hypothetical protein WC683_04555 [bacterium]
MSRSNQESVRSDLMAATKKPKSREERQQAIDRTWDRIRDARKRQRAKVAERSGQ